MNDSDSFERASAAALRLLSHRPRSEAETRTRLRRRFPAHVVERVMESLTRQGLVNDPAFASLWKDSRQSFRPRSAAAIRRELVSKGVSREVAETSVRDVDDHDAAYRAALKPAGRLHQVDLATFRRKLRGYLQRRGFSQSVVRETIARLWEERPQSESLPDGSQEDG